MDASDIKLVILSSVLLTLTFVGAEYCVISVEPDGCGRCVDETAKCFKVREESAFFLFYLAIAILISIHTVEANSVGGGARLRNMRNNRKAGERKDRRLH